MIKNIKSIAIFDSKKKIFISQIQQKIKKYVINTGRINSAVDKPNQTVLNALPLDFSKNLEIVVVDAWLIKPWPESLIKKIPKAKK